MLGSIVMQGKTTLLKIIGGLAQQDSGTVGIGSGALAVPATAVSSNGSNGSNGTGHTAAAAGGPAAAGSSGSAPGRGGSSASAAAARTARTGLVFQFPERHFLVNPHVTSELWCSTCRLPACSRFFTAQLARCRWRCSYTMPRRGAQLARS